MGSNYKRFYCLGIKKPGHWPHLQVTALMRVFCKKMYGLFAGLKKSGHNNKVIVLPRWP